MYNNVHMWVKSCGVSRCIIKSDHLISQYICQQFAGMWMRLPLPWPRCIVRGCSDLDSHRSTHYLFSNPQLIGSDEGGTDFSK